MIFMGDLPHAGGDYVLVLNIPHPLEFEVGRLGPVRISQGWALYVGSARGPGGLAARLARHIKPAELKRSHWHIDYLAAIAPIKEAWCHVGDLPMECRWAGLANEIVHAMPNFGSSDCSCASHLFIASNSTSVNMVWDSLVQGSQVEIKRIQLTQEHT